MTNAIGIFSKSGRYGGGFLLTKISLLIMLRWNNWLCSRIWKVSMPCSFGKDLHRENGLYNCSSTAITQMRSLVSNREIKEL
ncbi:MAG: hypothetical protein FWH53_08360 [Leptospirales bacterium]|nr:hypothetical protein [Leptospirales bacterium]